MASLTAAKVPAPLSAPAPSAPLEESDRVIPLPVTAARRPLLATGLGCAQALGGSLVGPLQFAQPLGPCGPRAVGLGPVQVTTLAVITRVLAQAGETVGVRRAPAHALVTPPEHLGPRTSRGAPREWLSSW